MIDRLKLRFGPNQESAPLEFDVTPVTVFVGPNNAGKSRLINEIGHHCQTGRSRPHSAILDEIRFSASDPAKASTQIVDFMRLTGGKDVGPMIQYSNPAQQQSVNKALLFAALQDPNEPRHQETFNQHFLSRYVLSLNGKGRIDLVRDQSAGDLSNPARQSFQKLFLDDKLRTELSELIYQAFGRFLVIDPTNLGQLRLRLSKVRPGAGIERSLSQAAISFQSAATPISNTSDGTVAFIGMVTEIMAGEPKVLMIDEPEAYLHPSLANLLGREISQLSMKTDKRVFVATHSPQFLMGCIQSGVQINVVRLTYLHDIASARLLRSGELAKLMRNPLLRSTGVISALFYESAVVTEGDPDRAFYQEINERLLRSADLRGIPNCIFLNAQNKQTIPTIVSPLRNLGIPAAAIYDIDHVEDSGTTATQVLKAAGVPQLMHTALTTLRASINRGLETDIKNVRRNGGVKSMGAELRQAANDYFDQLASYGTFVVRCGELECWLKELGITGHGPSWLTRMFERMGEDPTSPDYVQPTDGDIWDFMGEMRQWLLDPLRKGIPQ